MSYCQAKKITSRVFIIKLLIVVTLLGLGFWLLPIRIRIEHEIKHSPPPVEDYEQPETKEDFLAYAIIARDEGKICQLLDEGVSPNAESDIIISSKTFLMLAAEYGQKKIVEILVERGADINATNFLGTSALVYAIQYYHADIATFLISKGATLNKYDSMGYTPLIVALINGQSSTIEALIRHGADVNQKYEKGTRPTPLHLAVESHQTEAAKLLIDYGAVIDEKNDQGESALMIASKRGYSELVRLLLDKGATRGKLEQPRK